MQATHLTEAPREIVVDSHYDVVVCGAGPAGVAAAITAARAGARTCLVEHQGCLGGVWTSGLLSYILDARAKPGFMLELRERLRARGALAERRDLYDAEEMKLLLEELCSEAGVEVRLYSKLCDARVENGEITHVVIEAKEGRFALSARRFVDATGDGDLAARAGCGFDLGRPSDRLTQPMTLMVLVAGVPESVRSNDYNSPLGGSCIKKDYFREKLSGAGFSPSYSMPSIFALPNGLCGMMLNHAYEVSGLNSRDLTKATLQTRREVHLAVRAMRKFGPDWANVHLVATAAHIGVREGRRIHARYHVTLDDVLNGARHDDAVVRVSFPIDVHSLRKSDGGGYGGGGVDRPAQPYDIPVRALIAKDVDNLLLAGRCIGGDFYAHASYRVTGNAVPTGEAAGLMAALSAQRDLAPHELPGAEFIRELETIRARAAAVA
jgi:Dehydrogenases (flavoproteins)